MARTEQNPSSSAVLLGLWEDFVQRYQAQHGTKPSKQMASTILFLDDPSLLSRWTNADSRPGWRVPVRRIAEVAFVLELTPEEVQELMLARLIELEQVEPACDAVVVADWCAEVLKDAVFLDEEEQRILAAFREVTGVFGGALRARFQDDEELRRFFSDCLTRHDGPAEEPPTLDERRALLACARQVSSVALRAPQAQDKRHMSRPLRPRGDTQSQMRELARRTRRVA